MRKIIGFILCISILAGMYVPTFAKPIPDEKFDMMLSVLTAIDVVSMESDEEFKGEENISRAQFSEYVAKAMGLEYTFSMKYFNDVGQDIDEAGYINSLTDYGVISLNDERIFAPDRTITYAEACKMLVCAMGYGDYALSKGSTMSAWISAAEEAGINIVPNDYKALTKREAVILVYNAMYEPVMASVPGQDEMYIDRGTNLFAENYDLYIANGIVSAVNGAYLERHNMPQAGYAEIGNELFKTDLDLKEFLGTDVEYVYSYDDTLDIGTILYARLRDDESVVSFTSDLLENYDQNTKTFWYWRDYESQKSKKQEIEKQHQIILNGAPYTGSMQDAISGFVNGTRRGEIKIVDSDRNGEFEVVIIKSYEIFPIGSIDTVTEYIQGGFDKSTISYKDCDYFKIYNEDGEEVEISDLSGAVLNVARSQNDEIIEVVISTAAEEIKIGSVEDDALEIYSADGKMYRIDSRVLDEYRTTLFALDKIIVSLDIYGWIVKIQVSPSDSFQFGYLVNGRSFEDDAVIVAEVKIYTRAGKIEKYRFAERINIDSVGYRMSKKPYDALSSIPNATFDDDGNGIRKYSIPPQIVRYKVNEENFITDIDTTRLSDYEEAESSLVCRHNKAPLMNTNRLGLDTYWSSSHTATFTVPTLNDKGKIKKNGVWADPQAKDFSASISMSFDHTYSMSTYYCSDDSYLVDALVITQDSAYSEASALIFTGTKQVWDEEEQMVLTAVECLRAGSEARFILSPGVESSLSSLVYGDLFHVELDGSRKYATKVSKVFDSETMTFVHSTGNDYWLYGSYSQYSNWTYRSTDNLHNQLSKIYVLKKRAGAVFGTYERTDLSKGLYQEVMYLGDIPVVIIDKANEQTEKGSFSSIRSYEESGASGSMILLESLTQNAKSVIMYR